MERIEDNKQWKLQGDCTKCRRLSYCSKPCTHCDRRKRAEFKSLMAGAMNQLTNGVMSDAINKTIYGIF